MNYRFNQFLVACLFLHASVFAKENRPNIILIMADDMGYEALSSNGSELDKFVSYPAGLFDTCRPVDN